MPTTLAHRRAPAAAAHRHHPAPPASRRWSPDSLTGRLNLEWARLRTAAETAAEVARWAAAEPALAGCGSLAQLEEAATPAIGETGDAMLLALLRRAGAGSELAGRTLLQLMLGKLVKLARSQRSISEPDDAEAAVVAALYEVIARYPAGRRPAHVWNNLALDVLQRVERAYTRDRRSHAHELPVDPSELVGRLDGHPHTGVDEPRAELSDLLAWAVDHDVITGDDARLLARFYHHDNPGGAALAAQLGVSWATLRKRCSRAVQRLAAAAAAYPERPVAA